MVWISIEESLDESNGALLASRIANRIYDLRKLGDFNGDNVVIRDGLSKPSALLPSKIRKIFQSVKERIGTQCVQFLTCTKRGVRNTCLWNESSEPATSLEELSQSYIDYIVSDPHVVYRMNGEDTFQLPSGVESSIFYRVGNVQKDIFVLDDIFIFLFSHLRTCKTIVAETWSISTICYHAAKRIGKICGRDEPDVLFLSNYFDDTGEPERELNDILTKAVLDQQTPVTLMFSATASGLSWERIKRRIRPHLTSNRDLKVVSLLKLGHGASIPHLCKQKHVETSTNGKAAYAVPINKKTYFPDFVSPAQVSILSFTNGYKRFFERYAGRNIFKVHANSHTIKSLPSRHNAFYVNCEELVQTDEFRDRLKEKIKDLSAPKTLLFLDTAPNIAIADLIDDCFDIQTFKVAGAGFDELIKSILSVRADQLAGPIWILDSIAISGTTLGLYAKLVRDYLPATNVTFLIGLDRPDTTDKLRKRAQNLRHVTGPNGQYLAVEQVVLPDWGQGQCPWCKELRLLGGIPNTGNDEEDAPRNNRKSLLFSPDGLDDDVYLVDRERISDGTLRLGPRSLFLETSEVAGEVSQADIVCCVAAVAQQWRTDSKSVVFKRAVIEDGSQILPLTTVVGPTTFNDPVIRAALWRVFSLGEILPSLRNELSEFDRQFTAIVSAISSDVLNPLALEGAILLKGRLSKLQITVDELKTFEAHIVGAIHSEG
ncbi:hypothetical protein [Rhizobium leguminosarum]|uniref:hypothetical protein n=1 Tax=Rhizobium leguminosarum TaxID=384 RepID=UPI00102FF822|nr:hypothetical protein [Rhizobium leguminosarum]TAX90251.1 hypothetical protein ELH95_27505 [Rhizobium leguminosarum]